VDEFVAKAPKVTEAERIAQVTEVYAWVGKIVVHGELLANAMRISCVMLLNSLKLDQQVGHALFAGQNIEAMRRFFASLFLHSFKGSNEDQQIIRKLIDQIDKANSRRNEVVHTTWFVGWGNEETEDFRDVDGIKFGHSLTEGGYMLTMRKIQKYKNLYDDLERLTKLVEAVHPAMLISAVRNTAFHESFDFDTEGKLRLKAKQKS
jgi:hypothetical protein